MIKAMEFLIQVSERSSETRHFEIFIDDFQFDKAKCREPLHTPDEVLIYEHTDAGRVIFEPQAYSWAGRRQTVHDAFNDILERLIRNETGLLTMLSLDNDIQQYVSLFHQKVAAVFNGRKIPYEILCGSGCARLTFATNQFLYYLDDMDMLFMFRTSNGALVSDNEFAEIGFFESKEAIEERRTEEAEIVFTEYPEM